MPNVEPLPPAPPGWEEKQLVSRDRLNNLLAHGRALQDEAAAESDRVRESYDRRTAADRRGWEAARRFRQTAEWHERAKALHAARRAVVLTEIRAEQEQRERAAKEAAAEAEALAAYAGKLRAKRE